MLDPSPVALLKGLITIADADGVAEPAPLYKWQLGNKLLWALPGGWPQNKGNTSVLTFARQPLNPCKALKGRAEMSDGFETGPQPIFPHPETLQQEAPKYPSFRNSGHLRAQKKKETLVCNLSPECREASSGSRNQKTLVCNLSPEVQNSMLWRSRRLLKRVHSRIAHSALSMLLTKVPCYQTC